MKTYLLLFCILFGVFLGCRNKEKQASGKLTLEDCPVIARSVDIKGDILLPRFPKILVDKQTLKGCFVNLRWNMLGNIEGPSHLSFNRGYFTAVMEPYELKEQLKKALASPEKLSSAMLKKAKDLNNSITEDDNCIVFIGKLKTK